MWILLELQVRVAGLMSLKNSLTFSLKPLRLLFNKFMLFKND